jgi:hypothetical protein
VLARELAHVCRAVAGSFEMDSDDEQERAAVAREGEGPSRNRACAAGARLRLAVSQRRLCCVIRQPLDGRG